ncbi:unnamed protein product [Prorocentrum cordatum]|uniref:Kazal-like domain-containing protein n=1 Tax=Prorocentrum cordatum TaxID=2364126 RepID=A0ABN9T3S3_9DINO|nr:unnamed protein product [Polarella glacialis]
MVATRAMSPQWRICSITVLESRSRIGEKMDVMHVARTEFSRAHLQVRAYGNLSRSVSGGTVSVKMCKGSVAGGSSTADWMKRELAWHSVPHKYEEELCKHFGKSHSKRGCPLPAGNIELRFALDKLPPMVLAGAYRLKIRAIDAAGKHVACLQANVQVPRGKSGELFRRIQALPNAHNGRALTSGASDCNCDFSDPVCGDNGLTCDSACQAHCSSVKVAYTGKCGDLLLSVGRALS